MVRVFEGETVGVRGRKYITLPWGDKSPASRTVTQSDRPVLTGSVRC